MTTAFVVTCEHAGFVIPLHLQPLFQRSRTLLASHRGWDRYSWEAARIMAPILGAPLHGFNISRLVVDANRSLGHPRLHAPRIPAAARPTLLAALYSPFRERSRQAIDAALATHDRVVHLSAHTFTPRLAGITRNADIGLLYDPHRLGERELARAWYAAIKSHRPDLRLRLNYPYRGVSDGHTTALRRDRSEGRYLGFELELNQGWLTGHPRQRPALYRMIAEALKQAAQS